MAPLSAGCRPRLLAALVLLRQRLVQTRHHATARQGHVPQQGAEVVVVAHSERHRAGCQALGPLGLLARRLHGELQQLSCQVLQHRRHVHGARRTDTTGVLATAQQRADAAHGEDQAGLRRAAAAALPGHLLRHLLRGCHR
ncbi:histone H2A [Trypanosoma rangeli SC58]|uniref:Histone H2A n=1 Tax=Trypanosoma rangeli SC58 TaxID=429131 RepID=A0A061J3W3_TRYRA|nr:histone H2A [Trypanosoma rangeli SC58]